MTWQLGAFAILFVALAGGFGWYERTRPDARIVALVATLAAFAALGRIAFAALPNVKPTSDIVLVSGYALGGAPGFVVGALAGLTSNFFFGQGPWTPWQMAAWAATGMLGAGLAALTGRGIGRWPLAIVCAAAGFAFTAIQDVGDWVTYSDHSLAQLSVYVGKGLGFDAVYAVSCLVFALALGPALARSIERFATRLQVSWQPVAGGAVAFMLAGALIGQPARAASSPTGYLLGAQNRDGGFGSAPGQPSSELFSGWATLGLAAEGVDLLRVARNGRSLIGYIEADAGSTSDPGSLERTILALRAAGEPARRELAALERDIGRDGSVSNQTNLTSFAVLALQAAGVPLPGRMLGWLKRQQDHDGGFNFATAGGSSDVDDTGAALEALSAEGGRVTTRALRFMEAQQNHDGGFPSQPGGESNAQSTAWAVQGMLAVGAGGASLRRALSYLDSLIAPDGHIRYARGSDQTPVWVTAEAMMALARKPLPLATPARRTRTVAAPTPRAGPRRRAPARTHAPPGPSGPARPPPPAQRSSLTLATYAGIAAAVVFAPIGLG